MFIITLILQVNQILYLKTMKEKEKGKQKKEDEEQYLNMNT